MDEVTLQINVRGAGKVEDVGRLLDAAMALREPETQQVIPAGYRCTDCYKGDGSHEHSCQFYITGAPVATE